MELQRQLDGSPHEGNRIQEFVMVGERASQERGAPRGFARMDRAKQREIARKGGANVPHEKRSFAQNRQLASEAGRKGGRQVAPQARSFSQNRALAAEAGRKGGRMSQRRRAANGTQEHQN